MANAPQISEEFGVSLKAAEICFDRLTRKAERERSSERVRRTADEVIALLRSKPPTQPTYLPDPCSCGMATLRWEGTKVRCASCGFFGDWFQDGDKAG